MPEQLSIEEVQLTVTSSPNQSSEHFNEMSKSLMPEPSSIPDIQRITRRRSDSELSLKKSKSLTIDSSAFDPSQSVNEVKKLKVSCNKCGKTKSKIKREILKLSEQLKSTNKSEVEINAKIKEFLDYLESKSQPSEMTETGESQIQTNQSNDSADGAHYIPSSTSHDEIEEDIFDENDGINVYSSSEPERDSVAYSSTSTPRRFIQLNDIHSRFVAFLLRADNLISRGFFILVTILNHCR